MRCACSGKVHLELEDQSEARESRAKVVRRIAAVAARHPVLARSFSFPVMIWELISLQRHLSSEGSLVKE
jgi:hypothetical protein